MANLRKTVSLGFFWSFGERILAQGVSFIVSIILARFLLPSEYGSVAMVLVFINIANVFVSNGFGESLIQKKDATIVDFSTIFWCSQIMAWALYLMFFAISPIVAKFYSNQQLITVLRVLSLKLPLASINTIQHAYVSRHMQFKKFFWSTLWGTLISGVLGIILAYHGFGVWALVAQYLSNSTIDTIVLYFTISWKPTLQFSKESARSHIRFVSKMMAAGLINTVYGEMQSLVIGKRYTADDLAYYRRGGQFPSLFVANINTSVGKVLFPAMSNATEKKAIKSMTRRSMQITAYLICPLMFGLIGISEALVKVLLTEKWLPCVPYLQVLSLAYVLQPIQTANCQAIKALGKSDIYLNMEIVKKMFGIVLLIVSLNHGPFMIAISFVISVVASTVISCYPNIKLLGYSYKDQIKDLYPSFSLAILMLFFVYPIKFVPVSTIVVLILQIVVGIISYIALSRITNNSTFVYLMGFIRTIKQERA